MTNQDLMIMLGPAEDATNSTEQHQGAARYALDAGNHIPGIIRC